MSNKKKKIYILFTIICIFSLFTVTFSYAANNIEIKKTNTHFEKLLLINVKTREFINDMLQSRREEFDSTWDTWLKTTKSLGKTDGKNDDELYREQWDIAQPKFDNGFLVTRLITDKYLLQYAENDKLKYIFGDEQYWAVQSQTIGSINFTLTGDYFVDSDISKFYINDTVSDFIKDVDGLNELLRESGITDVNDVKLFAAMNSVSFMYIESDVGEYLIKLNDSVGTAGYVPAVELFKIYRAEYVLSEIAALVNDKTFSYNAQLSNNSALEKPTYNTEAEELQEAGLLQGNENGLDLLKSLTRAEAVTLLVRALGLESETTNYAVSEFADIANDNWAAPYAALAKSRGIANGISDTEFAPDERVTSDQFAAFALRAIGESGFNYTEGTEILIDKGIITEEQAETMDLFTRGDMAKIIYEMREMGLMQQ